MELIVKNPTTAAPLPAVEWNYQEMRAELEKKLAAYKGAVYTAAQMPQAKKDRATLNKVRDQLDTARKELRAYFLAPYNEFEAQMKELLGLVAEAVEGIDAQVKAVEQKEKDEKQEVIRDIYVAWGKELCELVSLEKIQNPRWLNKTYTLAAIEDDVKTQFAKVRSALHSIEGAVEAEYRDTVRMVYLESLDLRLALQKKSELAEQKKKMERAAAERQLQAMREMAAGDPAPAPASSPAPVPQPTAQPAPAAAQTEPETICLDFRVWATKVQLQALKEFLRNNQIKYGRVPKEA